MMIPLLQSLCFSAALSFEDVGLKLARVVAADSCVLELPAPPNLRIFEDDWMMFLVVHGAFYLLMT